MGAYRMDERSSDAGDGVWRGHGPRDAGSSHRHGGNPGPTAYEVAKSFARAVWHVSGWGSWCRTLSAYRRLTFARAKNRLVLACFGVRRYCVSGGASMDSGSIPATVATSEQARASRHRSRCVDVGVQLFAVLALTCGVTLIGVAFIGELTRAEHLQAIEAQRPKPTPQMMAPRQDRTKQSRVEVVNSSQPQTVAASVGW